jgi:hypothetical protein
LLITAGVERLRELAELGLLAMDTQFRLAPALIGCVAEVVGNPERLAEMDRLGSFDGDDDAALPAS